MADSYFTAIFSLHVKLKLISCGSKKKRRCKVLINSASLVCIVLFWILF